MSDHDKANAEAAAVMLLTAALDEMRNGAKQEAAKFTRMALKEIYRTMRSHAEPET